MPLRTLSLSFMPQEEVEQSQKGDAFEEALPEAGMDKADGVKDDNGVEDGDDGDEDEACDEDASEDGREDGDSTNDSD